MNNGARRNSIADSFDPVIELLRGGDPAQLAQRAGIPVEELLRRRDVFLRLKAQKATEEDLVFRKVGRNEACPCGSGRKYKKCCMAQHQQAMAKMDPEEVRKRTRREREKQKLEAAVREGYELLAQRDYQRALALADRLLRRYPEDDRLHDIRVTGHLYLGNFEVAVEITSTRLEAAEREKRFFLQHGRHSYEDPDQPLGHAYAPQAWLERYWAALKTRDYQAAYPNPPDEEIVALVQTLQKADDLDRFPQQREEGLRARREALAEPIEALKRAGARALPYLRTLCTRYSWTALMIPEILKHWADEASLRTLVEIALLHYPFLSESCLQALEEVGSPALPVLRRAFERDRQFDALKIGLLSVAGQIGSREALHWVASQLDHPEPVVVNWAGRVLGKAGHVEALPKIEAANARIGREPSLEWAIEELKKKPSQR
jgi:hypothetical protein